MGKVSFINIMNNHDNIQIYTKMNNCLRQKFPQYYEHLNTIKKKIKVKDSSKEKLRKEVAALIVSEIKKFKDEEEEDYEKKNNYINNLLRQEEFKQKCRQKKIRDKLKSCITNAKNKIIKEQDIEMIDI